MVRGVTMVMGVTMVIVDRCVHGLRRGYSTIRVVGLWISCSLWVPWGAALWLTGALAHTAVGIITWLIWHLHHFQSIGVVNVWWMTDDTAVNASYVDIVAFCFTEFFTSFLV